MKTTRTGSIVLAAWALLGLAAFQTHTPSQDPPKPAPAPAPAPPSDEPEPRRTKDSPLRLSSIPDGDKEKLAKQYELVTKWLSKDLGRVVEFVPVSDYAAAVAGIASNKLDVVWLGGVTAVQAGEVTKGKCWPVVAREEDLKFKSYFIANRKLVDAGTFTALTERRSMPLEQLAALKPKFAGHSFSFGAKSSTSGHIMPRYFLEKPEVGIDPEKGFKQKPGFALIGGHSTVLANVSSGAFDLGVINYLSWEQATDEQKAQAPVIYVTPEYIDYCMVLHGRLGPMLSLRVINAFRDLKPDTEEHKAVLGVFGTKRFVHVEPGQLDGLREIMKSFKERGVLE